MLSDVLTDQIVFRPTEQWGRQIRECLAEARVPLRNATGRAGPSQVDEAGLRQECTSKLGR